MASTNPCVPCCDTPQTTNIPGVQGDAGDDGADGISSFTQTTTNTVLPLVGNSVQLTVLESGWMAVGQTIEVLGVEGRAHFEVTSVDSPLLVTVENLGYNGDLAPGLTISAPATVSPSGTQPALSAALPTALTDNSTGTASNTIAAGAGVYVVSFYIDAAAIANGDLVTDYVPGHKFKILKFDARCAKPVTTGAKASNLNLEIDAVNLTGGVIALAGTYVQGAAQAGSAVTGLNTGSATQSISIEASATTAFVEGAFWLLISLQNLDSADAIASLADHVNDLITSLT